MNTGRLPKQAQELVNMSRPANRNHTSAVNFIEDLQPLAEQDREFIYHKEDLVTLTDELEHMWLDSAIEHVLKWKMIRYKLIKVSYTHSN